MGIQKKHGKGRLDKWYKLAKEKGYRARAAFKLIQLNKKYGFLEKSKVLLDLCAAPGSWCQVAAETMPAGGLIVGVDLAPIKPIPRTITFQSDIRTDKCRATIRQHLKTWKADTVLHDGAPNIGTAWVQDAFSQAELALQAMKLATEFLVKGGTFVTKVFRSKDYNSLMWVFNQLFEKVEATKPPSSRNVSAEIFVVCRGFKAPKRIDPRFLDARSVFAELADSTPNNEAKVFNPEKKKRKRDGYEEGDYTQFKEATVSEFIQTTDPIAMLGGLNKLSFGQTSNGDIALAAIGKLPETTDEIRECCGDLKVLGRKEFRSLLKWRLKVRERFGLGPKKLTGEEKDEGEAVTEIEPMDEELQIQAELQQLNEQASSRKKRDRRRENEKKQREIVRMQLHMTAPTEIGLEQSGPNGEDAMFALRTVDKAGALRQMMKGNTALSREGVENERLGSDEENRGSDHEASDVEEDALERELDSMYELYRERRSETDVKYRAKKARKENHDGDWEGFSEGDRSSISGSLREDSESLEDSSDDELMGDDQPLISKLTIRESDQDGLTHRAAAFFSQEMFRDISGLEDEPHELEKSVDQADDTSVNHPTVSHVNVVAECQIRPSEDNVLEMPRLSDASSSGDDAFEIVKSHKDRERNEGQGEPRNNGKMDIDIITAEAMTLAHQLASGERTTRDLTDEGFNKYAFLDRDGLPEWFLDDEGRHSKPHRPVTAAAAAAIKEKLRALNARPIKKVREAKDRKKFKAAQRLEKMRKKSALMADDEGLTEKDKAQNIAKMMSKAAKKRPKQQVKVVVARGGNKGISGRPRGVKGKYKIVDARLKKDVRAEKRIARKRK